MTTNEAIKKYMEVKPAADALKKQLESLTALIKSAVGDAESIDTGDYIVTVKRTARNNLDTARLYKDFPDIKSEYGYTSQSVSIAAIIEKEEVKTA